MEPIITFRDKIEIFKQNTFIHLHNAKVHILKVIYSDNYLAYLDSLPKFCDSCGKRVKSKTPFIINEMHLCSNCIPRLSRHSKGKVVGRRMKHVS